MVIAVGIMNRFLCILVYDVSHQPSSLRTHGNLQCEQYVCTPAITNQVIHSDNFFSKCQKHFLDFFFLLKTSECDSVIRGISLTVGL